MLFIGHRKTQGCISGILVNGVGLFPSTDWIVFVNEAELMRCLVCLGTDLKAIFWAGTGV
jgi:hypothetical protein